MAAVVALPFALMLMNMPLFSLVLVLIMNATNLPMPGFHAAKLGVMFQLIMIGTYFLSVALGRQQWRYIKTAEGKLVIWYGLWLIVLIAVRGAGLRSMGSTTWGGQRYIIQFVSILFFFVLTSFRLGKKHIRWIVWGSLFAGAIGSLIAWKTGDSYSAVENANEVSKSRLT
ncbi:MAG: hypothetical protein KAH06_02895, partial [Desulfobacterales bacterium]|nr:hypothetical protein [Desulfobacterales bacterium]